MKKNNKHIVILVLVLIFISLNINAQEVNVVDNKGTIQTVNNNTVTTIAIAPTSPVENDVWFDTSTTPNTIRIWDGTSWLPFANNFWSLTGNSGTTAPNFLGTTDAQALVLRTNNIEKLKIHETKGQVLINQALTFNNHPLVIRATGVDVLAFEDATGDPKWHWNLLANGLNFAESGISDNRLFLEYGGNIGINTGTPTERLDVNGRLRVRTIDNGDLTTDKVIVADTNGVIKKVDASFQTSGDIKNGVQAADHAGWYILDGRVTSSLSATAQAAANALGFPTNLPDAANRVLKHPNGGETIGSTGGQVNTTLVQANLPNITFPTAATTTNGNHSHTIARTLRAQPVVFAFDSNLTFYNNGGTTNTSTTGNHTHNVTVSSGGSDQSFERYQPYLVVNTFIYLGL
ncbi:hypothetical protein CXF68_12110 [Tenacibaculum sp. Bg11-29]|uniref:hypothetical protein n=1 Tax=Tenacibaculum sp. Bg11-29 TaxID=2058306 RepID=UPI000C336E49|nr:hypothetical protein [Tenacibaculum sp. Bg11-29]PKH51377.1 hypothetical protein CXF68_12110 [Tenacibaculum sp. Bg11-29]